MACATFEASENLTSEKPISPQTLLEPQQLSPSSNIMEPALTAPTATASPLTAPAAPATVTSAPMATAAAAADSSPAALLAASLVRSRATYFERLSSCNKASTSSAVYGCSSTAVRHSMTLTSQPLHPLAQHPLAGLPRSGGGAAVAASNSPREGNSLPPQQQKRQARRQRQRRRRVQLLPESDSSEGDQDEEDDSVDTFFDKPSYTCYGAAVELSPASSYGTHAQRHASSKACAAAQPRESPPVLTQQEAAAAGGVDASTESAAAAPSGPCCSGYVRSMSAHFARVSSNSVRVGRVAGMDGLFDDLVTHVGALLASHPDVEAQMGMVQGLSDRLLQLHALCETLVRKEDEVEHLRGVLRELTTTRADAIRLKVQMAESLNGLQQEYYKVLRSAQLAQGTCKQHSARAAATRKQLVEVQSELLRYKRAVVSLRDHNRRLRSENEDMATQLLALEQGRLGSEGHRSACYMALVQAQTPVLY
ncbi:hypothetical protein VaNZ11_009294 [Volvox africanus]|uniref:Uncharacterized protein n=1 Tax=Volvox africanus TaxID=51714 RepID=A0ABQ5S6Y6_9CHLO|nr:hypothetical protein VaNZ11_009294 [Volvox africanus]